MKADFFQRIVHLVERLFAEVGDAQQVVAGAVEQVVDREDAFLFEAVGCADGQADFGRAHLEAIFHALVGQLSVIQWNAGHRRFPPWG